MHDDKYWLLFIVGTYKVLFSEKVEVDHRWIYILEGLL
jgi:hypothetical protein